MEDYKKTFEWSFRLLTYSGLWKYTGPYPMLYKVYNTIIVVLFTAICFSEFCMMIIALPDIARFNYVMCTFTLALLILVKAVILLPCADRLDELQKFLNSQFQECFRTESSPYHLLLAETKVKAILKFLGFGMLATGITWSSIPFLDGSLSRSLPLPFWLPFDIYISPYYEYLYIMQLVIIICAVLALSGTDIMFCGFLIQAGAHYDLIASNLIRIGDWYRYRRKLSSKKEEKIAYALKGCIKHHQVVVRLVRELDIIYWKACSIHFAIGTLLVCFGGFEILVLTSHISFHLVTRSLYITVALIELFIYSAAGTFVITKSENVANAAYGMPWYCNTMKKPVKSSIMIILAQAQRPPSIVLGRLFVLNCYTYLAMLKAAYSVFSLLRQIVSKKFQ